MASPSRPPTYRSGDGARLALQMAEREITRLRDEARSYEREFIRSRRAIMRLDPEAPGSEYDGNAWHGYLHTSGARGG